MNNKYFVEAVEEKIKEHLSKMFIEEKVWQMGMIPSNLFKDESGNFSRKKADEVFNGYSIGGFQDPRLGPERSVDFIKQVQDYIRFNTKPGIPAIVIGETLHGYLGPKATIFPQVIGMASTWNTELIEAAAEAAAKEARAVGTTLANAPDLDLAREPRWGRVEETFGEDPYLVSQMGLSTVKGMQGAGRRPLQETVISAVKHYVAHGSPEGGVNISPVSCGERQLRELYLKPFSTVLKEGGALAVMPAYSEYDGIVEESIINTAVSRILRVKYLSGIMDNPYGSNENVKKFYNSDVHRNIALESARESIILLKNKDNLLPLNKNISSIAVIGPNADKGEIGDCSLPNDDIVTPLQGIKRKVTDNCKVTYVKAIW